MTYLKPARFAVGDRVQVTDPESVYCGLTGVVEGSTAATVKIDSMLYPIPVWRVMKADLVQKINLTAIACDIAQNNRDRSTKPETWSKWNKEYQELSRLLEDLCKSVTCPPYPRSTKR